MARHPCRHPGHTSVSCNNRAYPGALPSSAGRPGSARHAALLAGGRLHGPRTRHRPTGARHPHPHDVRRAGVPHLRRADNGNRGGAGRAAGSRFGLLGRPRGRDHHAPRGPDQRAALPIGRARRRKRLRGQFPHASGNPVPVRLGRLCQAR